MSLESTVNYLIDLNPAWPTGAESKADGDNHLRNIKLALANSFPGAEGALIVTGVDGGIVNAYTLSPAVALKSYTARMFVLFTPTAINTGPATLDISGLGIRSIKAVDGSALVAGDLVAARPVAALYDGTAFRLLSVTKNYIDQIVTSGIVPGVNVASNAGKFFTTDGTTGLWAAIDLTQEPGGPTLNKGNSGIAAQVVNYGEGEGQTITATGNFTLSASGFPAGRIAGVLLRLINGGAYAITTSGIVIVKADGTKTNTFSSSGIVLQASGESFLLLYSYGDGTVYMKAA